MDNKGWLVAEWSNKDEVWSGWYPVVEWTTITGRPYPTVLDDGEIRRAQGSLRVFRYDPELWAEEMENASAPKDVDSIPPVEYEEEDDDE